MKTPAYQSAFLYCIIWFIALLPSFAVAGDSKSYEGVRRQHLGSHALPNVPGHILYSILVELAPGVAVPEHRHEGFVYVYVLEGNVGSQLDDEKLIEYTTGDVWIEPPGSLHTLTVNLSKTEKVKLLAVFIAEDSTVTQQH